MNVTVILPAAGLGKRFAVGDRASASKIEFELAHKPVFLHAIDLFHGRSDVGQIILAVDPDRLDEFAFRWADKLAFLSVKLIAGGKIDRWQTVQHALKHVADDATHIAIHDAARPCTAKKTIDRLFAAVEELGAVVPGLAMGDTVKRVSDEVSSTSGGDPLDAILGSASNPTAQARSIIATVPRQDLYRVQTPQVFERDLLMHAYAKLDAVNAAGITDDASVVERAGSPVYVIEGDPLNLKLTHPADAELLEAVLRLREEKDAKKAALKQLFGDDED